MLGDLLVALWGFTIGFMLRVLWGAIVGTVRLIKAIVNYVYDTILIVRLARKERREVQKRPALRVVNGGLKS